MTHHACVATGDDRTGTLLNVKAGCGRSACRLEKPQCRKKANHSLPQKRRPLSDTNHLVLLSGVHSPGRAASGVTLRTSMFRLLALMPYSHQLSTVRQRQDDECVPPVVGAGAPRNAVGLPPVHDFGHRQRATINMVARSRPDGAMESVKRQGDPPSCTTP